MSVVTLRPEGCAAVEVQFEVSHAGDGGATFKMRVAGETLAGSRSPAEEGGVLRIGPRALRYYASVRSDVLDLWLDGATYHFALSVREEPGPRSAAGAGLPPGGVVEAPMPGRVLLVEVRAGERVERGAPLVIMESMKMELTISAPAAAVVADVIAEADAMVQRGAPLLRLKEPE